MAYELVAQGSVLYAIDLADYEYHYAEGQNGKLRLSCRTAISSSIVDQLRSALQEKGVEGLSVSGAGTNEISIGFRRGFPWLAVIGAVLVGLVVLAVLIVAWYLYREVMSNVPEPLKGGVTTLLVVVAAVAALGVGYVALKRYLK